MNEEIFNAVSVLPERIKAPVLSAAKTFSRLYEIRFVAEKSVFFTSSDGIRFVNEGGFAEKIPGRKALVPKRAELDEIVDRAAAFSGYLYEKQLKDGFITYGGGCRMSICSSAGSKSFSDGTINSVSVRIPCFEADAFGNISGQLSALAERGLLVAGPPSSGKTTLLRQIALKLSDGFSGEYRKVAVIDERGEIAGGKSLGFCTDIIGGKSKSSAILHAVRLMSPDYIICDEIGGYAESSAILQGLHSGVRFAASVHAGNIKELIRKKQFRTLFDEEVFSFVAMLSQKGTDRNVTVFTQEEINYEIGRSDGGVCGNKLCGILCAEQTQEKNENSYSSK